MSGDFALLLLTAVATAYGFWASLRDAPRWSWAACAAALLFLGVGLHTTLVVTVTGAGGILPGHQLDPNIQVYWAQLIERGDVLAPRPEYMLIAILAYILAVAARPGKAAALRVLPSLLVFVAPFFTLREPEPIRFERANYGSASAFLTMITKGKQVRLVFSVGDADEVFLPILHEHEAGSVPPSPSLWWSRDAQVITLTTRGGKPYFAVDRDKEAVGWLPSGKESWPDRGKAVTDSVAFQRTVSTARVEVAKLLDEHGGPARK
ncbi:MAG: hypothetical protein ACYS0F_04380 [Planctomycetota bacterium]